MVEEISVSDMLKKLDLEKEVEQQRKILHVNFVCESCGSSMTPDSGCWLCLTCGESEC